MRFLLLALMIALLPLRGWVGDAMAMKMIESAQRPAEDATNLIANHSSKTWANTGFEAQSEVMHHAECPDHAALSAAPADSPHPDDSADCATCTACQICHTLALTPMTLHIASAALPAGLPQASAHLFASAERAPGFKPPIFCS